MASRAVTGLFDAGTIADRWIADYCAPGRASDTLCARASGDEGWTAMLEELAAFVGDEPLDHARERAQRHAEDIGTGFRIAGEGEERPWPLSPVPLMIPATEWDGIASGVVQRADLFEAIVADIYGEGRLVAEGHLPAALVTGSPFFLRPLQGMTPPGGYHLQFIAADLGRGPDGEWRVLADPVRAPAGAGYAIGDAGLKAFGMDHGNPALPGGRVLFCSDEHVTFAPGRAEDDTAPSPIDWELGAKPAVGDRVRLVPAHVDPTLAYHDRLYVADGEEIVDEWAIDLRGWVAAD